MIKSTEFRKGNYIKVDGVISRVEAVGYEKIAVNGKYWQEDQVYTVDITEDIIPKTDIKMGLFPDLDYFSIQQSGMGNWYCLYFNGEYTGVNIDYVHELQNLYFAITGVELTINI
jgi:hypothetical protein